MLLKIIHSLTLIFSILALLLFFGFAIKYDIGKHEYPTYIHKTLYLDRDFTQDEVVEIISAAFEWTEATQHVVEFDVYILPSYKQIEIENAIIINKVNPDNPEILIPDSINGQSTLGIYNGRSYIPSIYLVEERLDETTYKAVVLHELGHALGLMHTTSPEGIGTLMYPNMNFGSNTITQIDLNNFCHLYHCNLRL